MEKEIRVKLSTVIYLFIIFALITALGVVYYFGFVVKEKEIINNENKTNNTDIVISKNEEKNNIIEDERGLENTNKDSDYIWEEYPNDCRNMLLKAYFGEDYEESDYEDYFILENGHDYLNERLHTLYSLWNKYSKKEQFPFNDLLTLYIYNGGDSTEIIERESNYNQYLLPIGKSESLKKYSKPITYKIAAFSELYDISLSIGANDKEPTLEERTTAQSKDLKSGKKDYHYDDIPDDRNFYYEIPELLVMNGNNTNEDDYKNNARAKKIKVTFNNKEEYIFDLKDTNEVQIFDINYKQNTIATPVNIEIEVLEKYSGEKTEDVYISDIQFSIESNIPQGR